VKSKKLLMCIFVGVMLAATPLAGACAEAPTGKVVLTYGALYPTTHTYSVADLAWLDYMQKKVGDQLTIVPYWGATLITEKNSATEVAAGVADLGYVSPGYSPIGYDIHKGTLGFYYGVPDYATRRRIYTEVTAKFPQIEAEFTHMKVLCTSVGSTYQLISKKPVRTINDFKGLKVKATGSYMDVIKALGGEGISMPMSDVYLGIDKGTIDAALVPYETLKSWKFGEVAKYVTILDLNSAIYATRCMNLNSWNKLPKDIQKAFEESKGYWESQDDAGRFGNDQIGYDLGKTQGVEYIKLSAADISKVYEAIDTVMRAEAKKIDDKGLPGTAIFQEVRSLAAKYTK